MNPKQEEIVTSFGHWVRRRRKALDLTQAALAQAVGCAVVTVKKIEWDERRPSLQMAERLADSLAIPTTEREQFLRLARGEFVTATLSSSVDIETRLFKHNLPPQPTPFIGREKELAVVTRRLEDHACRLLTLIGPGGIGKTRLAIQAAQTFMDRPPAEATFGHGILFVPLTTISSPSGIVSAIAEAAHFPFYNNVPPQQQLLGYLREKEMLLVLDNFEHLLTTPEEKSVGGVTLITEILAVAPAVKILVTSREALNLKEAWFQPLAGLSFPPPPSPVNLESGMAQTGEPDEPSLDEYDAIKLFTQSARRSQIDFSLAAEANHVVRICQLVEGMPLGIDLAAAWLKSLPAEKIAQEIEHSLDILAAPYQNVPERHHSIRAVFEHSWQLLAEAERDILKQLSVFQGDFDQAAAAHVTGVTLSTLALLVEKSLLQVTGNGRYQMHELLRQFAAEKLKAAPKAEADARKRHSQYYLGFLTAHEPRLTGKAQRQALEEIDAEMSNVRAGWLWAVRQNDVAGIGQSLVSLYHFCQFRSLYHQGQELLGQAMTHLEPASSPEAQSPLEILQARLAARRGALKYFLGDFETAKQLLQASLNRLDSPNEQAFALIILGDIAHIQKERLLAEQLSRQGLVLSRETGDLSSTAKALRNLALLANSDGKFLESKQLLTESLALSRQQGSPDLVARILNSLGWATHCLGAYSEAEGYWEECLAISQDLGNPFEIADALSLLGWAAYSRGGSRLTEATAYIQKAVTIARQIGRRGHLAMYLGDLALIANESEEFEQAAQYSREGLAITEEIGSLELMAYNLYCLGTAICGLGDFQTGRDYIIKGLSKAWEAQVIDQATVALFYLALSLARESDPATSTGTDQVSAENKRRGTVSFCEQSPGLLAAD